MKKNKLKAVIIENGFNQANIAKMIGVTPKTFYLKMKRGVFGSDEIKKMIKLLKIKDPIDIFFEDEVT